MKSIVFTCMDSITLRKVKAFAVLTAGVGLTAATTAVKAMDFYLDIVNNTTQAITQVWVSPVASESWGTPFKGTFVPYAGGRQRMQFSYGNAYSTTCNYDVRVQFANGQTNYWSNVNICTTDGLVVDVVRGRVTATAY